MKKTIISILVVTSFAHANAINVKMGGLVDAVGAFKSEIGESKIKFSTSVQGYAKATNESDNGLGYGGVVSIKSHGVNSGSGNNKNHIFLKSGWGKLEFGQTKTPSKSMAINAGNVAIGTGGINGCYDIFLNKSDELSSLTKPITYVSSIEWQMKGGQKHNKITYYSPEIKGMQIGVSFSPDSYYKKADEKFNHEHSRRDMISYGASIKKDFPQNINLQLSIVGDYAPSQENNANDGEYIKYQKVNSYQIGMKLSYDSWGFACSYGTRGQSDYFIEYLSNKKDLTVEKNSELTIPRFWTAGLSYGHWPLNASLTYMHSQDKRNVKFNSIAAGLSYEFIGGFKPYVEFVKSYHASDNIHQKYGKKYSTSVLMIGSRVKF